ADQVVPVGGCEWKDRNEFLAPFAGKPHKDKEWLDGIRAVLSLLCSALLGNGPDVFSVVKNLFVLDVVGGICGGLSTKQEFRIPHMSLKKIRHLSGICKYTGKHSPLS